METATSAIQTCKSVDPTESYIIDLDALITETKLTIGNQSQIKNTISQSPELISEAFCSSLSQLTVKPTFPFPELIHWSAKNYALSSRQILSADGTRVICNINSQTVRRAFNLLSIDSDQLPIQFSEENNLSVIKALDSEQTSNFMSKMFRVDVSPSQYSFLFDISLLIPPIQVVFALLSQSFGLESD